MRMGLCPFIKYKYILICSYILNSDIHFINVIVILILKQLFLLDTIVSWLYYIMIHSHVTEEDRN